MQVAKHNIIYSKTAIQAVKKGAAKSGSPTQDDQGEKVVKSRCGQEMVVMVGLWQTFLMSTIQVNLCAH